METKGECKIVDVFGINKCPKVKCCEECSYFIPTLEIDPESILDTKPSTVEYGHYTYSTVIGAMVEYAEKVLAEYIKNNISHDISHKKR